MDQLDFNVLVGRRPWVALSKGGTPFIGPSVDSLILAYYVTQGETCQRAKQFADAHIAELKALAKSLK